MGDKEVNLVTPSDKRDVLAQIEIGNLTISEDGKISGYIRKDQRDELDFDELMQEADRVIGSATISFQKFKDGHKED